jgi:pantoate--beta-alanine ligase
MFNIYQTIAEIREKITKIKSENKIISVVPTMGALHQGHLSLIEEAKKQSDFIIVTIFVNEKQFNNRDDFNKYPRNLESDIEKLQKIGVNAIFIPSHREIYPEDNLISINIENVSQILCGSDRACHFDAVALIIIKLFSIINPDIAIFGLKDYQQFFIIKILVRELNFNVKIIGIETIRDKSGLALSSRNLRLNFDDKKIAENIFKILHDIRNEILEDNNITISNLLQNSIEKLIIMGFSEVPYLEIRDEDDLKLCHKFDPNKKYRIFISAIINKVRLIDNLSI